MHWLWNTLLHCSEYCCKDSELLTLFPFSTEKIQENSLMTQIKGGARLDSENSGSLSFSFLLHLSDSKEKIIFLLHVGNWMRWKYIAAVKKESTNNPPQHYVQMHGFPPPHTHTSSLFLLLNYDERNNRASSISEQEISKYNTCICIKFSNRSYRQFKLLFS